jgi:hypothetical protein
MAACIMVLFLFTWNSLFHPRAMKASVWPDFPRHLLHAACDQPPSLDAHSNCTVRPRRYDEAAGKLLKLVQSHIYRSRDVNYYNRCAGWLRLAVVCHTKQTIYCYVSTFL